MNFLFDGVTKVMGFISSCVGVNEYFDKVLNLNFFVVLLIIISIALLWYVYQKRNISVFISVPILSCGSNEQYQEIKRAITEDIIVPLQSKKIKVVSAILQTKKLPEDRKLQDTGNFAMIKNSQCFVLICPKCITKPSSIFVEAGYALALKKRTFVYYTDKENIPELLRIINIKFPAIGYNMEIENENYGSIFESLCNALGINGDEKIE